MLDEGKRKIDENRDEARQGAIAFDEARDSFDQANGSRDREEGNLLTLARVSRGAGGVGRNVAGVRGRGFLSRGRWASKSCQAAAFAFLRRRESVRSSRNRERSGWLARRGPSELTGFTRPWHSKRPDGYDVRVA